MAAGVATQVNALSKRLSLTQRDLAGIVGASPRTVNRWVAGTASPQRLTKQRLLELAAVSELMETVFTPEGAHLWMFQPEREFRFESPAELVSQGRFREVVALLEALADGVVF